ncbi:MAG: hypothetical protein CMJ18_25095 [Phycisphaeraceae bacterium]|nr:hypothetical protein [Phycisphaeraceae bacterium]
MHAIVRMPVPIVRADATTDARFHGAVDPAVDAAIDPAVDATVDPAVNHALQEFRRRLGGS